MTLVLDSGGVSSLSGKPSRVAWVRSLGSWPPLVPAVVLAECLTGDHRRDFHTNRLLAICQVLDIDEPTARAAAYLRTQARRRSVSAADAIVVAVAEQALDPIIVTGDVLDIGALVNVAQTSVLIQRA